MLKTKNAMHTSAWCSSETVLFTSKTGSTWSWCTRSNVAHAFRRAEVVSLRGEKRRYPERKGVDSVPKDERVQAPVAELFPPQGQWTEADYFALPDTNRLVELSEGRLIMPPHPSYAHQEALKRLFVRLNAFVEENGLGTVQLAPLPVRLWPGKVREPDILFLAKEHADRAGEQHFGVPDLIMEVTSPGTRKTDRGEKYFEYARARVWEYWLADPDKQVIEVYSLQESVYEPVGRFVSGETVRSELLPGFHVDVSEVFQR